MRIRLAALATALLLAAAPAYAAGMSGIGAALFGNGFDFKKVNLTQVPVKSIEVGGVKVTLQTTKLRDIQKAFGGTLQTQGEGASRGDWLCYAANGANIWFISNALGGYEFVMIVAVEAAPKPGVGCDAAPAKLSLPNFGIPALGASAADLKKQFGNANVRSNKVSYRAEEPGADALGTSNNAQYIGYVLKGGKVAAVGVGETSVQIAK